jgi:hypothetical protein
VANSEKARANSAAWRVAHPEKARANVAAWWAGHPEKRRAKEAAWRAAHPEKAKVRNAAKVARAREKVFAHYGQWCACCGSAENLTIDHVNGDGKEHRAELGRPSSYQFYLWLIREGFPSDPPLQVLCLRCNQSKKRNPRCRLNHGAVTGIMTEDLFGQIQ